MTDKQIEALMYECLNQNKDKQLYYMPDDKTALKIIRIGEAPLPEDGVPEPTVVAFTHGGKYISLDSVEYEDFKSVLSLPLP